MHVMMVLSLSVDLTANISGLVLCLLFDFLFDFSTGMTASATEAAFQLCPDMHTQYFLVLQLGGWGKGVKFLAQGKNSSRMP